MTQDIWCTIKKQIHQEAFLCISLYCPITLGHFHLLTQEEEVKTISGDFYKKMCFSALLTYRKEKIES